MTDARLSCPAPHHHTPAPTHRSARPSYRQGLLAAALAAALLAGCGGGADELAHPLLPAGAGMLLSQQAFTPPADMGAVQAVRLRYRMAQVQAGLTEANALLFAPAGVAPAGGWPLLVWAHGTTGVSDACAPSRDWAELGESEVVRSLLAAGYAVLAPDYEGLDAPGVHPYLNRDSEGKAVVAAVRAAQHVPTLPVTRAWAVMGHSQGGHAALAAAEHAPSLGPNFPLKAVLAFAPASNLANTSDLNFAQIDSLVAAGRLPEAAYALATLNYYGTLVSHGLQAAQPQAPVAGMFGAALAPLVNLARDETTCHQFGEALAQSITQHLLAGGSPTSYAGLQRQWHQGPGVREALAVTHVGQVRLNAPVWLAHGDADLDVHVQATTLLAHQMRALGTSVTSVVDPGADHEAVVRQQMPAALQFLRAQGH